MKRVNLFIIILLAMGGIFIYSGCSSSGVTRYGAEENTEEEETSSVRFTSKDENNTTKTSPDTSSFEYTFEEDFDETDSEDIPEEFVDFSSIKEKLNSNIGSELSSEEKAYKDKILEEIVKYLNTPYKFGGNSIKGIDCSAFTQTIFNNALSITLLRSAREQYTQGIEVNNLVDLKFGDLVFFNTRRRVRPGHVGIYIGSNLFAHASSKYGVIVSTIEQDYYSRRFMGGRRIENLF
jgi:cell wall-associated NlpC family hydrolase